MLSVHLNGHGWLSLLTIEAVLRSRLDARVGSATAEVMKPIEAAPTATLDMR